MAESDYYLRRYRASADALKPFVTSGTRPAEALFYYALAQHDLKDNGLYHALMRRVVGAEMGVKAAGGVRDLEGMKAMIAAGATRVGASAGVKIVQQARGEQTSTTVTGY